ncbi:MAG TPA: PP2C family protein-serine/threonine phosphatase [Candidatus Dormibacteraeota bacterium]|nr:PP2C family protein-serine/threonine phosphatase [Candidatus Dormibacteraeota bacterium]
MKKIDIFECTVTTKRPFGCMELWAGNERVHRQLELAGLEGDIIALPSGSESGGDLSAVFSCSDDIARVVLADCVGHGYEASGVARHVHKLLHKFQDVEDTPALLGALNDEFTLSNEGAEGPLRLTTVVTGTFDSRTGEFRYAYAAHPRMLQWVAREGRFLELGEGLGGMPMGIATGEQYLEQSIRLLPGDMIVAFSDGATEIFSASGEELTSRGFLRLAEATIKQMAAPAVLHNFSETLLDRLQAYRGGAGDLADDVTLMTLRHGSGGA